MLENTLYDLRAKALAALGDAPVKTTVDPFSVVRFLANLRPENTEAVFSSTHHSSQAADIHAFDAGIGDTGQAAGFGPNTTLTERHTNLRQKRKPNDSGKALIFGVLLEVLGISKPKTTTNAGTIADDSDDTQYVPTDSDGFVTDRAAHLMARDYACYVQKTGGQKEFVGPIRWEATESGKLFALLAFPEGYVWGGAGQGSELIVGFERKHLTYNAEWATDADRPWEDVLNGLDIGPTGSQPAAGTVLCNMDVAVKLIGAQKFSAQP